MKRFLWVIATGLLARGLLLLCDPTPGTLKHFEPSIIADNLNAGRGFVFEQYGATYHAWKEPLYIILLSWLSRGGKTHAVTVMLVQSLFGIATALGVSLIGYHLFRNVSRAVVAGMIASANPFLVYYDTHFIHPLSLDALLFVATALSILWAMSDHAGGLRRSALAGLMMGFSLWQRATLLVPGLVMWLSRALFPGMKKAVVARRACVWLVVALLIIAPWLIRNYRLFGRLILTTDAAHILWLGNNPHSNGTYSDGEGQRVFYLTEPELQAKIASASELEQYEIFLEEVKRFVRTHPGRSIGLFIRKLWAFFWFSPNAGIEYNAWQQRLYRGVYILLLIFGVGGLIGHWKQATPMQRHWIVMLMAAVGGLALLHAATAINMKHRVPWELVLSLFAAESLVRGVCVIFQEK